MTKPTDAEDPRAPFEVDRRFCFDQLDKLDSAARIERQPPDRVVELVRAASPRVVLDIGIGTGTYALPIAQRLADVRVVGLDIEPRMLAVVAERAARAGLASRISLVQAPADRIPIDTGAVDVALMVNLYHELPDRKATLAEVRRVLSHDGMLLLCDWDPMGATDAGPPAEHRVARDTAERELASAGFDHVSEHQVYPDLYVFTARSPVSPTASRCPNCSMP